jgi:hypothetical protein
MGIWEVEICGKECGRGAVIKKYLLARILVFVGYFEYLTFVG